MKKKDMEDLERLMDMLVGKSPDPERYEREKEEYLNLSEDERDAEDERFLRGVEAVLGEDAAKKIRHVFGSGEQSPLMAKNARLEKLTKDFMKLAEQYRDDPKRLKDLQRMYDEERRKILES